MFRRRKPHASTSPSTSSKSSVVIDNPVALNDEAESSINLDNADYNHDGAELVSHARRIMARATNQELGGDEYQNYMIEAAQNVLVNEPGRRLRFADDDDNVQEDTAEAKAGFSDGLDGGVRGEFGAAFYDEAYGVGFGTRNENFPTITDRSRRRTNGKNTDNDTEDESVFTINIDVDGENVPSSNQLARTFDPTDFKWLCLGGAVPLTMICGMSNGISYCGPTGMILGYVLVTPGVLIVLTCISEMIAFYPMDGGFTLLVCEYIEAPLGLAIGVLYWMNCALTVPIELLQSIKLLSVFPYLDENDNSNIVFLTFFLITLLFFSCLTTRAQSPAIRFASVLSFGSFFVLLMIIWIVCIPHEQKSGVSLQFWRDSGGFRPINSNGSGVNRWRQVAHACSLALRSYSGIDVAFTAMPEIRNARRTIKSGFHMLSARMLIVYPLLLISFTFVTDPEMWQILVESENFKRTICRVKNEWLVELMQDGIFCSFLTSLARIQKCTLFYLLNAFIVFCGVFDAGIQLYGASRTLHGLGYSRVLWKQLSWCTRERVPVVAVVISALIATVSYASVGVKIGAVFTYLQLYVTHTYLIVWATVCWAFIRYFYALRLQEKRTNVRRDGDDYPFKSWFQPWTAMLAITWCIIMFVITTAEQYYFNLSIGSTMWKGNFASALLPLAILGAIYFGHKWKSKSKLVQLDQIGIMAAKRKMDAEEWEEDRVYSDGIKERVVRWLA